MSAESDVDQMLRQFKERKQKLTQTQHAESAQEATTTTTSTTTTPEPTARPISNSKPVKPNTTDRDSSSSSSGSASGGGYVPVEIDRRLPDNYRPTDVPGWMYSTMRTRTYAAGHSPVFHADRTCRELNKSDADRIKTYPLRFVVERDVNPRRPCAHCTMGMAHTIQIAIEYDHVAPADVVDAYLERGDFEGGSD